MDDFSLRCLSWSAYIKHGDWIDLLFFCHSDLYNNKDGDWMQGFNQQTWPYSYIQHFKSINKEWMALLRSFMDKQLFCCLNTCRTLKGAKSTTVCEKDYQHVWFALFCLSFFHTQTRKHTLQAVWCFNPPISLSWWPHYGHTIDDCLYMLYPRTWFCLTVTWKVVSSRL